MPARGCEEIEAALDAGVCIEQIFCFDASSAVIATSEWRKKYPEIKFCTSTLGNLWDKMRKLGKPVSAINMDLCGTVAGECVDEISDFLTSAKFSKRFGFGVNIAKGREGRTLLRVLRNLETSDWFDCDRMAALWAMLDIKCNPMGGAAFHGISQGSYRENKTPMSWATFSCRSRRHGYARENFVNACKKAIAENDTRKFNYVTDREHQALLCFAKRSLNNIDIEHVCRIHSEKMARLAPFDLKEFNPEKHR